MTPQLRRIIWERGLNAIDAPRSLWLDVEMAKVKRKTGRPKKTRTAPTARGVSDDATE